MTIGDGAMAAPRQVDLANPDPRRPTPPAIADLVRRETVAPDRAVLIDHGRELLAGGRWDEARAAFARALVLGETAELHEDLGWAARGG